MDSDIFFNFIKDSDVKSMKTMINNGYDIKSLKPPIQLTDEDKKILIEWFEAEEHTYYMKESFRIDLEKYVFIVKMYTYKDSSNNKILYGIAIKNTSFNRALLLEERMSYVMSTYM